MKKGSKKAEAKRDKKPRADNEDNRILISTKMFEMISKRPRIPSARELSEATGLCQKTIERHLKHPSFKEMKGKLRAMNDRMLIQFASKVAKSSNPAFWDMYWTLTEPEYAESKQKKKVDFNMLTGWDDFKLEKHG